MTCPRCQGLCFDEPEFPAYVKCVNCGRSYPKEMVMTQKTTQATPGEDRDAKLPKQLCHYKCGRMARPRFYSCQECADVIAQKQRDRYAKKTKGVPLGERKSEITTRREPPPSITVEIPDTVRPPVFSIEHDLVKLLDKEMAAVLTQVGHLTAKHEALAKARQVLVEGLPTGGSV